MLHRSGPISKCHVTDVVQSEQEVRRAPWDLKNLAVTSQSLTYAGLVERKAWKEANQSIGSVQQHLKEGVLWVENMDHLDQIRPEKDPEALICSFNQ